MTNPSSVPETDPIVRLEQEVSRLAAELRRTERSLGGFQWALALLVLGGVAAVVLIRNGVIDLKQVLNQPAVALKVESKGFDFFNRSDKRVLLVEDDKFGYPSLVLLDADLRYRMGVTIAPDAPGGAPEVALYDNTGTRAQYRIGKDGEALIQLLGERKKGGIILRTTRDGKPSLTMLDPDGKVLFHQPEGASLPPDPSLPQGGRR